MRKSTLIWLLILQTIVYTSQEDRESDELFVPSEKWQVIKPGQKIPKGLHVRINFATGVKEAKLLDPAEDSDKTLAITQSDPITAANSPEGRRERLRAAQRLLRKLQPKTDAEVMADLVARHALIETGENRSQLLPILEDLAYLVHQYDNGLNFVRLGGLHLIYTHLNSTDAEIREESLKLFASLTQNSVEPKVSALETGGLPLLLKMARLDPAEGVRGRALGCLSALLRSFPAGQRSFVRNAGVSVLGEVAEGGSVRDRLKAATLLSDLIVERGFAVEGENSEFYGDLDWLSLVGGGKWCEYLYRLLVDLVEIDKSDYDSIEKCLTAIRSLGRCDGVANLKVLVLLRDYYGELAEREQDEFYDGLKDLCVEILKSVRLLPKSEL